MRLDHETGLSRLPTSSVLEQETESGSSFWCFCATAVGSRIGAVIDRLPVEVREFVSDHILFVSGLPAPAAEAANAVCVYWPPAERFVVMIGENDDADWDRVVAHEIAHAWRGHADAPDEHSFDVQEREADETAACWGWPRRNRAPGG